MKEYIKKFESASAADNYAIADIPFTSTVEGGTLTNLVCSEENKKIVINDGQIEIVDNTVKYTLSYYIKGYFWWVDTPPTEAEAGETITLNFKVSMTSSAYLDINGDYVEVQCTPDDNPHTFSIFVGSYTFTMPAQNTTIICHGGGGSND